MEDTHIKNLAQAVVQAGELLRQKSLESLIAQAALTNAQIALAVELCDGNLEPLVERRHVAIVFDDSALDCVWDGVDGYNLTLIPRL